MRIALINENSQADKNGMIYEQLKQAADKYGHKIINLGKYSKEEDRNVPYTEIGLLASAVIATGMAEMVVTGCGTGQGAAISCNSMPNLVCGIIHSPLDMYLFSQINAGNVVSLPYSQKFGWGSEVELLQIFDILCSEEFGKGYPEEYAVSQKSSRIHMSEIKKDVGKDLLAIYKKYEKNIKEMINSTFKENFIKYHNDSEVTNYLLSLIE